ncbi:hypothetical protein L1887_34567 [Cichorium endivia]|nr:hypothetical protein L1887_34567 [Cichorium endivia]
MHFNGALALLFSLDAIVDLCIWNFLLGISYLISDFWNFLLVDTFQKIAECNCPVSVIINWEMLQIFKRLATM